MRPTQLHIFYSRDQCCQLHKTFLLCHTSFSSSCYQSLRPGICTVFYFLFQKHYQQNCTDSQLFWSLHYKIYRCITHLPWGKEIEHHIICNLPREYKPFVLGMPLPVGILYFKTACFISRINSALRSRGRSLTNRYFLTSHCHQFGVSCSSKVRLQISALYTNKA